MACKISDIDDGGYDVMFIEEPPEFLLCIVCHLALRNPIQIIDCGHRFCRSCFKKIKSNSNERGIDLLCPLDRQVIDVSKPHLDMNCLYEFVSCAHEGCEEKSERRLLDEHMTNCSKRVVVAADNLKLIQILTQRLQDLQESQDEIKQQLREGKDELKDAKDELKKKNDKLNDTKDELNETKGQLKLKGDEMKKFQERIVTLENDFKQLQKCNEEIVQNRDNFSSPWNKPNFQILSEKIGEEVIQVKRGEWFTWESKVPDYNFVVKSNVVSTFSNSQNSPSYLTDDGYHFKIEFFRNGFGYILRLDVFKDLLNLKTGSSKKTISLQIGDYKNNVEVNMFYRQNDFFDTKSSWCFHDLNGLMNIIEINKHIINNYIPIYLKIE